MKQLVAIAVAFTLAAPVFAKDKTPQHAQNTHQTKAQNNVDGRSAKSKGETQRATPATPGSATGPATSATPATPSAK